MKAVTETAGLEAVVQEVLDEGKREAAAILEAARKEREALLSKARAGVAVLVREREAEAAGAVERRRVQEIARAELEAKRAVLNGQKALLDEVYQGALQALPTLAGRDALTETLLRKTSADWRAGRVFCAAADERAVRAATGGSFAGTIDCAGGIVIETADGRRRLDLRFETRLQDVWQDMVREVAQTLWPKG